MQIFTTQVVVVTIKCYILSIITSLVTRDCLFGVGGRFCKHVYKVKLALENDVSKKFFEAMNTRIGLSKNYVDTTVINRDLEDTSRIENDLYYYQYRAGF